MIAAPIVVTMMLVALWHGATLPFLLFGLLHAGSCCSTTPGASAGARPAGAGQCRTDLPDACWSAPCCSAPLQSADAGLAARWHGRPAWGRRHDRPRHPRPGRYRMAAALYAIVWFAPSTRQWMQAARLPSRLDAVATLGRRHGLRRHARAARRRRHRRIPVFPLLMRYLRIFRATALLSFALVWVWVAGHADGLHGP